MRHNFVPLILAGLVAFSGCTSQTHRSPSLSAISRGDSLSPALPGLQSDGSVLLPNLWSLRPTGKQVDLRDFPINVAVHPSGSFAAVLHGGFSRHQILIIDIQNARVISHEDINQAFYGLEFSHDGKILFCSGAGEEVIHSFEFSKGNLSNHQQIRLRDVKERGVPAGIALAKSTGNLYVANVWGHHITRLTLLSEPKPFDIAIGTNATAPARVAVEAPTDFDAAAASKRAEAALEVTGSDDPFPYACRVDETRNRLYVSLWAQSAVAVIDLLSEQTIGRWPVQEHPCEMVLTRSGKFLFVANSARNTVTVFDADARKPIETIGAALYPNAPPGSTPNSLALSPDEQTMFVANADNNVVAVFDISTPGKTHSLGFIPVGWYPTSVRVTPDGKHLLVANGKGNTSRANPLGPQPGVNNSTDPTVEYIGRLFRGTLSIIDLPPKNQFPQQLAAWTALAYRCSPLRPNVRPSAARTPGSPIPANVRQASPIRYCIYVIKENRTYDQVLGDMPQGNGEPKLCLFPESVTPNHHKLAKEFVLLDNFYVESEVSADGHEWSMAAYATDFVEKMWPLNYGHNHPSKFPYPAEGKFPIARPANGYLWERAQEAGVTYRSYGEFVDLNPKDHNRFVPRLKSLRGHIDELFHGFDLSYSDQKRVDRFIEELKRFEADGDMPRLQIVRLPNDHTQGATIGQKTPRAYLADNDLALGRFVDAVSHSRFWPSTAIFVVEDDAQNGPDHVDAHRTIAFVISPYTKRSAVDSTMYSTSSMLRTMELILGLKPMSQFDTAATPMFNSFENTSNLRPYDAVPANVNLDERNGQHAWGGELKMDFSREDAADDLLLNEVIWRSVRGAESTMPPPTRAAFVFSHEKEDD